MNSKVSEYIHGRLLESTRAFLAHGTVALSNRCLEEVPGLFDIFYLDLAYLSALTQRSQRLRSNKARPDRVSVGKVSREIRPRVSRPRGG